MNAFLLAAAALASASAAGGQERPQPCRVRFSIVDEASGAPLPCRIHLLDAAGKAMRADPLPFFADHIDCPGTAEFAVPPGKYSYAVERGPEFGRRRGTVEAAAGKAVEVAERLRRIADLAAEGWWSGDLHVHRPPAEMDLLLRAEDLHVAPVITWWNRQNPWKTEPPPADPIVKAGGDRCYSVLAGEDERRGGAFLFFGLRRPIDIAGASPEYPSPIAFLEEARRRGAWIEIEKPFWWDVPAALALGFGDSIGIAHNHLQRSGVLENEAWGKPRDRVRFPPPRGNGLWSLEIYHHILNAGFRIPPSAGSASGVLPNPVGYNRVYVHLDGPFSHDAWWRALRDGRCFVTNGPLLRVRADGRLPGHVFSAPEGRAVEVPIEVRLDVFDPVPAVEVVRDGAVALSAPSAEVTRTGRAGTLRFERSGWFLVRAVADVEGTFRFASTGPFYVEVGERKRRASRASIRFFIDWMKERMGRIDLPEGSERAAVLRYHQEALRAWEMRLAGADAE